MKPIGILGGTFDPVHHGHLRLALECLERAHLSEVRFIPLHTPPHRQGINASGEQRLKMLELAMQGIEKLIVDDCELQRERTSYTVDTLELLRKQFDHIPVCLIMGMDAFQKLNTWHEWKRILDYAHILVADRPGEGEHIEHLELASLYTDTQASDPEELQQSMGGKILRINMPMLNISATQIRKIFLKGRDPRFLLPDNVIQFIQEEELYNSQP